MYIHLIPTHKYFVSTGVKINDGLDRVDSDVVLGFSQLKLRVCVFGMKKVMTAKYQYFYVTN